MEDASRAAQDVMDISFDQPEHEDCSGVAKLTFQIDMEID